LTDGSLTDADYQELASFRYELRRFLRFSEDAARAAGLTPQQHQLLVAVRGHVGDEPATVGEIAESLQIKHHSAVGLLDRMEEAGLVRRVHSPADSRRVHVMIAPAGEAVLHSLASVHRREYRQLEAVLRRLVDRISAG
jgi:DNA-binding MarR family transcriptional regulator